MTSDPQRDRICLNCTHWLGDRDKMRADIERAGPIAIAEEKGWPEDGRCSQAHRMETEVDCMPYCYGGSAVVLFPAWFGCNMFARLELPDPAEAVQR